MPDFRYSRWDGAQQVFDLDGEDVMEQLSEHLVNHSDIAKALEALAKDGLRNKYGQGVPGVDEMLRRLKSLNRTSWTATIWTTSWRISKDESSG